MSKIPAQDDLQDLVRDVAGPSWTLLRAPPDPNWQWCMFGSWGITFNVHLVRPPSRFNRLMQRWLLGIHWRPVKGWRSVGG